MLPALISISVFLLRFLLKYDTMGKNKQLICRHRKECPMSHSPLLSIIVPVYNVERYLCQCLDSLLAQNLSDYEIILVDDGSTDQSGMICDRYASAHSLFQCVHKPNGGLPSARKCGFEASHGQYVTFVDSDDWVDGEALKRILTLVRNLEEDGEQIDMLISNFVYEKVGASHKKCVHYRNALPQDEIFRWDDMGHFRLDQYILMHSVIYRTDLLKLIQLRLPKHTFYVDNIYVYYPLPHVRKIYYLDVDFYRYFIGRDDQSVNEKNMIARADQQIFVTKTMIDMYELKKISSKKLRQYMVNYLAIMMTVSSIILIRSKTKENIEKKRELWKYLKMKDFKAYVKIRYGILGQTMNIPGKSGRKISSLVYSVARRIIGFN